MRDFIAFQRDRKNTPELQISNSIKDYYNAGQYKVTASANVSAALEFSYRLDG